MRNDITYLRHLLTERSEQLYQEAKHSGYCLTKTGVSDPDHEACQYEESCQEASDEMATIRRLLRRLA